MNRRCCLLGLIAAAVPLYRARAAAGGVVDRVIDGDTFMLLGGDEVRLAGILAPKPWQLRKEAGRAASALPARATERLGELLLDHRVALAFDGRQSDRNGRLLAQVQRDDGIWVQGEILSRGLARVATSPDNHARAAEMLALEREARTSRRGVWAVPEFRVVASNETPRLVGSFQIAEGEVHDARKGREQIFAHFGADRRNDLTLAVASTEVRRFRGAGLDPLSLAGRQIRVRGWVKSFDGPLIDLTHPEQIELLT